MSGLFDQSQQFNKSSTQHIHTEPPVKINNATFTRKYNTIVQRDDYDSSGDESDEYGNEGPKEEEDNYNQFLSKTANQPEILSKSLSEFNSLNRPKALTRLETQSELATSVQKSMSKMFLNKYKNKNGALTKIDQTEKERKMVFEETDIYQMFIAKLDDQVNINNQINEEGKKKIQESFDETGAASQNMPKIENIDAFNRFKVQCNQNSINRKIKLNNMALGPRVAYVLKNLIVKPSANVSSLNLRKNFLGNQGVQLLAQGLISIERIEQLPEESEINDS